MCSPVLALPLSACGGGSSPRVILNTERVERAIEASVASQRHLQAMASCPDNTPQRKGYVFYCAAIVHGHRYSFRVTETDGVGHVRYVGL